MGKKRQDRKTDGQISVKVDEEASEERLATRAWPESREWKAARTKTPTLSSKRSQKERCGQDATVEANEVSRCGPLDSFWCVNMEYTSCSL